MPDKQERLQAVTRDFEDEITVGIHAAMRNFNKEHPELGCANCPDYPNVMPLGFLFDTEVAKWIIYSWAVNNQDWAKLHRPGKPPAVLCSKCFKVAIEPLDFGYDQMESKSEDTP